MMKHTPYARFDNNNLILRDELAIDRTLLANERTLLAYLRSGMALVIAGLTIMNLSQAVWFWMVEVACLPIGIIAGIVGVVRYQHMNNAIVLVRKQQRVETSGTANTRVNPDGE